MFKKLLLIGLALSCCLGIAQANDPTVSCAKDGKDASALCDLSFTKKPIFGNMCVGFDQTRVYTVKNNTPVTQTFDYIRVVNADGTVNLDASIIAAATDACGTTLAAGDTCNFAVNIHPTAPEVLDLLVEVKFVGTSSAITSPIMITASNTCGVVITPPPVVPPVCPIDTGTEILTFTIENTTLAAVTLSSSIQDIAILDATLNVVGGVNSCGATLAAGATCNIYVLVTAGADVGLVSAVLNVVLGTGVTLSLPIDIEILEVCGIDGIIISTFPALPPFLACDAANDNLTQRLVYVLTNTNLIDAEVITSVNINNSGLTLGINAGLSTCTTGLSLAAGASCTIVVDLNLSCPVTGTIDSEITVLINGTDDLFIDISSTVIALVTPTPTDIDLNAAVGACLMLGGSTITNTGLTVVTDTDVCALAVVGFDPFVGPGVINGGVVIENATVIDAAIDAVFDGEGVLDVLLDFPCTTGLTGENLGGMTLGEGVYCSTGDLDLTGTLTLVGDASTVIIIQITGALTVDVGSQVVLSGVLPENVYFVEGFSASLGAGSQFQGNIIGETSIVLSAGANLLDGTAIAGLAVVLDANTVTAP